MTLPFFTHTIPMPTWTRFILQSPPQLSLHDLQSFLMLESKQRTPESKKNDTALFDVASSIQYG